MAISQKRKLIVPIVAAIVVVVLAAAVFFQYFSFSIKKSMSESMIEIVQQNSQTVSSEVTSMSNRLKGVAERTRLSRPQNVEELCAEINLEMVGTNFFAVWLIDDRGTSYSSANVVLPNDSSEYVTRILAGEENFVYRDESKMLEVVQQSIYSGTAIEPFKVGDITIVGVAGLRKVTEIRDLVKSDSFNGQGYTALIDTNGSFVISKMATTGIGKAGNFYADLESNPDVSTNEAAKIKQQIQAGDTFVADFTVDGELSMLAFTPVGNTGWTMILVVPDAVVSTTANFLLIFTVLMLVAVIMIVVTVLIIFYRTALAAQKSAASAEARGDFLRSMSHEIRTPLNGIIGLTHLMRTNLDDREKVSGYLDKTEATSKYLLSLVNDILDMNKLQSGKVDLDIKPLSLNETIDVVEANLQHRMEEKHIDFIVERDISDPVIEADGIRVQQVLMNILSNAAKFTDQNGQVRFTVTQRRLSDHRVETICAVQDNGCGMSEEFARKVFDSFSQERNTVSDATQGTGLGMSISSTLAKQMGGSLTVSSQLGVGSTFTFAFPAIISDQPEDSFSRRASSTRAQKPNTLNILVAEDNELNALIIEELLTAEGHTVTIAEDGRRAVELFEASQPNEYDLILMDIQMPNMNGYEATRAIRALDRKDADTVPIFACTADSFSQDREKAAASGMDDFIAKPINVEELKSKIACILCQ